MTQKRAIDALKSENAVNRVDAIHDLERLYTGDLTPAASSLVELLRDPVVDVRVAAAEALGVIPSTDPAAPSAVEVARTSTAALIYGLKDSDKDVRAAAARSLGVIASYSPGRNAAPIQRALSPAAPALMPCLRDSDPAVRSAAVTALGEFAATRIPVQAPSKWFGELVRDPDASVRLAALEALARQEIPIVPAGVLLEAATDPSAEVRAAAVRSLKSHRAGLDPWIPALPRLAEHDPDAVVRKRCSLKLLDLRPPAITSAVVPHLVESLRNSNDAGIRRAVIQMLGTLGPHARVAIPELLSVLTEPVHRYDLGSAAAEALGKIGRGSAAEKKIIASLTEIVRNGPDRQRASAARALGEFGPTAEDAVPVLIDLLRKAMLNDTNYRAWSAAKALGEIAPSTQFADESVAALLEALNADSPELRSRVIESLALFGMNATAAIPKIRALREDRNPRVRNAAVTALHALR